MVCEQGEFDCNEQPMLLPLREIAFIFQSCFGPVKGLSVIPGNSASMLPVSAKSWPVEVFSTS